MLPPDLRNLNDYSQSLVKNLPDFLSQTVEHRLKTVKNKSPRQSSTIVVPSINTASIAELSQMKAWSTIDGNATRGTLLSPRRLNLNASIDSGLPQLSMKNAMTERSNALQNNLVTGKPLRNSYYKNSQDMSHVPDFRNLS